MCFNVGDLVAVKVYTAEANQVGLVVNKKKCHEGLQSSHIKHLVGVYADIYYVFFPESGSTVPVFESNMTLKQSRHETDVSIDS